MTNAFNIDCMEYMKTLPDNAFELAVVDPPYGDGKGGTMQRFGGRFGAFYGENTRAPRHTTATKKGGQLLAQAEDGRKSLTKAKKS